MKKERLFRLAITLGDSSAGNFTTNLGKIIKLVLFDSYGKAMKVSEIVTNLNEIYSLEFSYDEVKKSINKVNGIVIIEGKNFRENKYTLNIKEYEKLRDSERINIDDYINMFLEKNECKYEFIEIKELIYHFLYETFNADKNTVLELMDLYDLKQDNIFAAKKFEPDQARAINEFLNWDYEPKNEMILNIIAACFEYCMLTVKKDTYPSSVLFGGKVFFLDSNIIFRLAGFNNAERKNVMNAFVKKCMDVGIKLCYTNYTAAEITNTVKYHVKKLKGILGEHRPLSVKAMRTMGSKYANLDFYDLYENWCKRKGNIVGDFDGFNRYLEKEISKVLRPFKKVIINKNYVKDKKYDFNMLVEDFSEYKEKHYRNTNRKAIEIDVFNYLYMIDSNNNGQASTFVELKYFFVTADHCLTDWSLEQRPGTIPMFVLPSVWYSILLKYKGRTPDDYKAFCQFLNIRIAPEKDKLKDIKEKILPVIMNIDEDVSIKEEIVYDIESRLNENTSNIEDVKTFVEESHNTILERKMRELDNKHKEEISLLKKEIENIKSDNTYEEGQDDIINKQAKHIAKRNNIISVVITSVAVIAIIVVLLLIFLNYYAKKGGELNSFMGWCNKNQGVLSLISIIISIFGCLLQSFLNKINILSTDTTYIKNKLKAKYQK